MRCDAWTVALLRHLRWLGESDVTVVAAAFGRSGFRGGLNYYRNLDRN